MEDLIAVRIANSRDEGLISQEVLELPGVTADSGPPLLERQGGIVGVGARLLVGEPRDGPLRSCRQQVDLAHLRRVPVANLGRLGVGRHPRRATGPLCRS